MVFNPNSRESCEYYHVNFETKKKMTKDEIDRLNYESETRSLMPRPNRGGRGSEDYFPQQSRDYALSHTIPCECSVCPANKNQFCEVPSLIKINPKGQCRTGLAFVEQNDRIERSPETIPSKKNSWTPDWFWNRWDSNCPQYSSIRELNENILEEDTTIPGHADYCNDIHRVHKEKGIR